MGATKKAGASALMSKVDDKPERATMSTGDVEARGIEDHRRRSCLTNQLKKTKFCSYHLQGVCQYGDLCTFAHDCSELQGAPDLRRTRLCVKYANGGCQDPLCTFAHGDEELRSTHVFYKKNLCIWYEKGRCRNGDGCRFAHGLNDLRGPLPTECEKKLPSPQGPLPPACAGRGNSNSLPEGNSSSHTLTASRRGGRRAGKVPEPGVTASALFGLGLAQEGGGVRGQSSVALSANTTAMPSGSSTSGSSTTLEREMPNSDAAFPTYDALDRLYGYGLPDRSPPGLHGDGLQASRAVAHMQTAELQALQENVLKQMAQNENVLNALAQGSTMSTCNARTVHDLQLEVDLASLAVKLNDLTQRFELLMQSRPANAPFAGYGGHMMPLYPDTSHCQGVEPCYVDITPISL